MAILRKPSVKVEHGWRSDASVTNAVHAGLLTRPISLGSRSVGWPDYEVRAIIEARIAGKSEIEIQALVTRLHSQRSELATA